MVVLAAAAVAVSRNLAADKHKVLVAAKAAVRQVAKAVAVRAVAASRNLVADKPKVLVVVNKAAEQVVARVVRVARVSPSNP